MKSNYSAEKKIFFKELPVFVGATTQVFLALVAIIINVILHAKIRQEKRKLLDQKRREGSRNKIPSVNYIALSLLLILACVLGLVSVLDGESTVAMSRMAISTLFCVLAPALVLGRDEKLRKFALKTLASTFAPLCSVQSWKTRNAVQPG